MFSPAAILSFAALFLAHAVSAQTCARTYTVQAGDICDSISAAQNVSTYQLATVNPGIDSRCDNLTPGEQLCLGYQGSDCTTTYVVAAGQTCDTVATTYGMNTTLLIQNNPQIDANCDNMYVGEVLCVAADGTTVPVSSAIPTATATASSAAASATESGSAALALSDGDGDDGDDGDDTDYMPYCDEL